MGRCSLELRVEAEGSGGACVVTWVVTDAGGALCADTAERFELAGQWLRFGAVYGPFDVNRRFAAVLTERRPARVVVDSLCGITLELARIALAFGIDVVTRLPAAARVAELDPVAARWLGGVLRAASGLLPPPDSDEAALRARYPDLPPTLPALLTLPHRCPPLRKSRKRRVSATKPTLSATATMPCSMRCRRVTRRISRAAPKWSM
jgi:hypothetical protein